MSFWSINSPPGGKVTPDIKRLRAGDLTARGEFLHPADLVFQFHGVTDDQARQICELAVEHIVAGQSCDSDFRAYWERTLTSTVAHYVDGTHE